MNACWSFGYAALIVVANGRSKCHADCGIRIATVTRTTPAIMTLAATAAALPPTTNDDDYNMDNQLQQPLINNKDTPIVATRDALQQREETMLEPVTTTKNKQPQEEKDNQPSRARQTPPTPESQEAEPLFSHKIIVQRDLPHLTLSQARQRCLQAWRVDNLDLPLPFPPFILDWGDEETGLGFVLARVPPLFLKEGIVAHHYYNDNNNKNNSSSSPTQTTRTTKNENDGLLSSSSLSGRKEASKIVLQYKVLNPGYLTWPVKNHLGTIVFYASSNNNKERDEVPCNRETSGAVQCGCQMEWIVEWTPLWMPIPFWPKILQWIHVQVITRAANYIAKSPPAAAATISKTSLPTTTDGIGDSVMGQQTLDEKKKSSPSDSGMDL
ncbi:hypothetical protein ACA910_020266 [Epithemia clementina (nom. ined.)]